MRGESFRRMKKVKVWYFIFLPLLYMMEEQRMKLTSWNMHATESSGTIFWHDISTSSQ